MAGFIKINSDYFKSKKFCKLMGTKKFMVLQFLISKIVRDAKGIEKQCREIQLINKHFYSKGMLVARFSQENLGEYLGTSQTGISRCVIELEELGLLKRIKAKRVFGYKGCKKKTLFLTYYLLGTWKEKYHTRVENLFFDEVCKDWLNEEGKLEQKSTYEEDDLVVQF